MPLKLTFNLDPEEPELLHNLVEHVHLGVGVSPEDGGLGEGGVDPPGHRHVGQQHELLDHLVAGAVLVQPEPVRQPRVGVQGEAQLGLEEEGYIKIFDSKEKIFVPDPAAERRHAPSVCAAAPPGCS